eukprot:scaffold251411_cov23-Tisochrysis_lutea.AAC.2
MCEPSSNGMITYVRAGAWLTDDAVKHTCEPANHWPMQSSEPPKHWPMQSSEPPKHWPMQSSEPPKHWPMQINEPLKHSPMQGSSHHACWQQEMDAGKASHLDGQSEGNAGLAFLVTTARTTASVECTFEGQGTSKLSPQAFKGL